MESLSVRASLPDFKPPTTFPFQRLPTELQLLVLQHSLVSPAPILDPSEPLRYRIKGQVYGQDQISPRIIFTCRLFYKEGLAFLYGHNVFMYTGSWTAFGPSEWKCNVRGCQRCGLKSLSPPSPDIFHPPYNWNFAFKTQATNINLRLLLPGYSNFLEECLDLPWIVHRFTNLQTLQLDFLFVAFEGSYAHERWDGNERMMDNFQSTIRTNLRQLQDPDRPAGALKEIVLTGLPPNGTSLYVVKQYTRLLAPHGRFGVGWGAKGRRYQLRAADVPAVTERDDLELLSMSVEEVGEWIKRESQTMGISGSKWFIAGQEEPEADVSSP